MKTIILLAIFALLLIVSLSNAKNLYDNDDMELTDANARMFLRAIMDDDNSDDADLSSFETRQAGNKCVSCKFGMAPCCAPNICRKKRFRPDECMEVKTGK